MSALTDAEVWRLRAVEAEHIEAALRVELREFRMREAGHFETAKQLQREADELRVELQAARASRDYLIERCERAEAALQDARDQVERLTALTTADGLELKLAHGEIDRWRRHGETQAAALQDAREALRAMIGAYDALTEAEHQDAQTGLRIVAESALYVSLCTMDEIAAGARAVLDEGADGARD